MTIDKITQAEIDSQLTPAAQSNASGNFLSINAGKAPTPRTPLFKDLSEDQVLAEWYKVLDRYESMDVYTPLVEYDKSRRSKVGPQGGLRPLEERMDDLMAYWNLQPSREVTDNYLSDLDEDIIKEMRDELFGVISDRRPLTPQTVIERDLRDGKLITNSGTPDYGKRNDPEIIANAISAVQDGSWKDYYMILGSRSQRGKERFIFIAPFALNIVEKMYLYPLMDIIRSRNIPFFSAWEGFAEVERGFATQNFFTEGNYYVQQDYTAMDKYFNEACAELVAAIISPVFQKSYEDDLSYLFIQHLLNIPVMINLDKIISGQHGMPSGSGLTNFSETIVSMYICKKLERDYDLQVSACQGLGDDLAISISTDLDPEDIKRILESNSADLGLIVEPEKQGISQDTIVYLQRFFDKRIPNQGAVLGMYPSILALNTAMNPERYHSPAKWGAKMETLRWLMILENCKNLPYFTDLVDFFIKGDKLKLGLVEPDFFVTLPSTYEESKAIAGFVPSYNQESLERGIQDFEVVKYLLSKRSSV
uniref:RdRp n=1 Tax=viral metagenome TaxID=1070528 RepID=A0A2V0RAJ9_9ZZZZ